VKRVTVRAPASSANLGAGFDVFALALAEPFDTLVLQKEEQGVRLSVEGLSHLASGKENAAWGVANSIIEGERLEAGVSMSLRKGVPIGVGLGSSAASSAAAAVGMNSLFSLHLPSERLVQYAGVGEEVASGTAHYDNVTASILGGFVIISKEHGLARMNVPPLLALCLATPETRLPRQKTRYARSLLPKRLPLPEVVETVAASSIMVHGFADGNVTEIGNAMGGGFVDDWRAAMIPGFKAVKEAAKKEGALGVCISGAGPTLLAVAHKRGSGRVLDAMIDAFEDTGVKCQGFITTAGKGCKVVENA
jgi:homoserine kinase